MGVLLDSTFLIDAERRGLSVPQTLLEVDALVPSQDCGISVISVMEMAHGEARAVNTTRASIRALFLTDLMAALQVYPVTAEVARSAGRLDGYLTKRGEPIAFPDLIIGMTALELGYSVVTRNLRHFQRIPGLTVLQHGKH
jgi:predicted nucleic acid-binding protein